MSDDKTDHTITNLETGEEMPEEQKAKLRAKLADPDFKIMLAPGVEEDLAKAGITLDQVKEAMMKGANNKLV